MKDEKEPTALDYARTTKNGIKKKADKNKKTSTLLFATILLSSVSAPILILSPIVDFKIPYIEISVPSEFLNRYLPAIMSACAAYASCWLQLRKPQERWAIYRTAQREIEFEINKFKYEIDGYASADKEKILADQVNKRALQLHYEWMPYVPKAEDIDKIIKGQEDASRKL